MTSHGSEDAAYRHAASRHRLKLGGYPTIEGDDGGLMTDHNTNTQLLSQDPRVLIAAADLRASADDVVDDATVSTHSKAGSRRNLSMYQRTVNAFAKLLRRFIAYLTAEEEDDSGTETERAILRYIPESVDYLHSVTKFSREELKTLYRNFKNECPNGMVNEETLKHIYGQFFPDGDSDAYAHLVFKSFDRGNSGVVNFERFAIGLSRLLRGTLKDRLRWTFELYDAKGLGYITKDDVATIVRSVYKLLGSCAQPQLNDDDVTEHVDRVFDKLDLNRVGKVEFDDFYEVCTKDESVVLSMSVFDHAM